MSPHRTTRASSRSPRTPGSKAILTPTSESPKSTKCELNGHISTHLRPRQASNSPNKLSPHDVNSLKDTSNSYRRSSRVNRGLDYHKSESEDNDNEGHNSEHETRTRSLRKDRSKRENIESRTSSCKRARREERSTHDHSFVTSDDVSIKISPLLLIKFGQVKVYTNVITFNVFHNSRTMRQVGENRHF